MISPEQFRERLRPAKKEANWTKWIGSPTAWLALILSAATFYTASVRKNDDLKVVINKLARLFIDKAGTPSFDATTQDLIFMNAGNRPIAVNSIGLKIWFWPAGKKEPPRCGETTMVIDLSYDFTPLIIKPGEMSLLSLAKFKDVVGSQIALDGLVAVSQKTGKVDMDTLIERKIKYEVTSGELKTLTVEPLPSKDQVMRACLSFQVILPDTEREEVPLLIGSASIYNHRLLGLVSDDVQPKPVPRALVRR